MAALGVIWEDALWDVTKWDVNIWEQPSGPPTPTPVATLSEDRSVAILVRRLKKKRRS